MVEQNAPDSTFGFGVVFSEDALEFLKEDDPAIFAAITPELESWKGIAIHHRGERVMLDGIGFTAIGRLHLLQLLQKQVRDEGIAVTFNHPVDGSRRIRRCRHHRGRGRRHLAGAPLR